MKRKSLLLAVVIIIIMALSCMLVACNNTYSGEDFSIEVFDGETSLGKINQDTIKDVKLVELKMDTTNDYGTNAVIKYKGIYMKDCVEKANITLPEITNVTGICSDNYGGAKTVIDTTNLDNVFLAFSGTEDGKDVESEDFPLIILDKNNNSSMYKLKDAVSLNLNFAVADSSNNEQNDEEQEEQQIEDHLQFSITATWENDTNATFEITDGQGEEAKTNIVKVDTANNGNTTIEIEHKGADNDIVDLGESKIQTITYKDTEYKSYKLSDIISFMKFKNKSGNEYAIIEDYTKIGFVYSDDEEDKDYSTRFFTKNEVENSDIYIYYNSSDELTQTRTFVDSDNLDNTLDRNKLKMITKLLVYQENE